MSKIREEIKRLEALEDVVQFVEGRIKYLEEDAKEYYEQATDEDGNLVESRWQYDHYKSSEEKAKAIKDILEKLEKMI